MRDSVKPAVAARWFEVTRSSVYNSRWKDIALEGVETLFQGESQRGQDQDRIAELERMVGRLTMELESRKESLGLAALGPELSRSGDQEGQAGQPA